LAFLLEVLEGVAGRKEVAGGEYEGVRVLVDNPKNQEYICR